MLKVTGITKRYGDFTAVDGLSFEADRGKIYGLIGPNGAGKSTTIRMIMNILRPDSGAIELDGKPFGEESSDRIGYLPEERGLYKKQKLNDVLLYLAALKGCPARAAQPEIDSWLERFGLAEWKNRKVDTLSKGMSQKIQFIATVIHDPDLVLLDEPFSGLDPVSADEMLAIIRELKERGKLILFSTHVMEQAEKVCDHIIMLNKGKKILDGDLRSIRNGQGQNSVTVRFTRSGFSRLSQDDAAFLSSFDAVSQVVSDGSSFIASLAPGASPDGLFAALAGQASVSAFLVNEPSLHAIFVNLVQKKEADR